MHIAKIIVEMFEDNYTDTQILLETMANYYCEHNDSYSSINPPKKLVHKCNNCGGLDNMSVAYLIKNLEEGENK